MSVPTPGSVDVDFTDKILNACCFAVPLVPAPIPALHTLSSTNGTVKTISWGWACKNGNNFSRLLLLLPYG